MSRRRRIYPAAFLLPAFLFGCGCAPMAVASEEEKAEDQRPIYLRYAMEHEGDVARGEQLFRDHPQLQCTHCHNISGMEKSGPNLEGIADKFGREELIRQVLYPSESVKPGFEQTIVLTHDGQVHVGRLERANKAVHRMIDAQGQQKDVPSEQIESKHTSAVSLMPENLVAELQPDQFADLMAYLQTLSYGINRGLIAGGKPIDIPRLATSVEFRSVHPGELGFENPVWCGALPGTERDLLIVEHHSSRVWRWIRDDRPPRKELFLDLSGQTYQSNNQGLTCIAFHPQYATNRRYFLKHEVEEEGEVKTTVVERRASDDGLRDSGQPSRRLLALPQPAFNHNGGCLAFGPDGMLYIAFGDGGPQKDPPGHSQNPRIFHGSMLRIDVDRTEADRAYSIPPDNPFIAAHHADAAVRPETWAIGFREPWRFSFDSKTGELYLGDVGQDSFEEVCLVRRGENHGWNVREAFTPFSDEYRREGETYTDPLFAYEHGLGFSVTGGHVYRGRANPSFDGVYVFGDYNTRRVWGLRQKEGVVTDIAEIGTAPASVTSFGVDQQGELYLVSYLGTIYHIDLSRAKFP